MGRAEPRRPIGLNALVSGWSTGRSSAADQRVVFRTELAGRSTVSSTPSSCGRRWRASAANATGRCPRAGRHRAHRLARRTTRFTAVKDTGEEWMRTQAKVREGFYQQSGGTAWASTSFGESPMPMEER
jgi:hypothetical protein